MANDFLGHLSSRVSRDDGVDSATSGLRPRLASRFEVSPDPILPAIEETPKGETPVTVERSATQASAPVLSKKDSEQTTLSLDKDQRGAIARAINPGIVKDEPETIQMRSITTKIARPESTDDNIQPGISPRSDVASIERGKKVESHQAAMLTPSVSADKEGMSPKTVAPVEATARQLEVIPEQIEITRMEREMLAPAGLSRLVPALAPPERPSSPPEPESQAQPPTVNVTIGRIEVKAIPPASPPKRRASTPPVMSLEEYLQRPRGGER